MIKRCIFALQQAMKYKKELKAIPYVKNITVIDWHALQQSGIRVVVLDFDGVLAADKQKKLEQNVHMILNHLQTVFENHIYIFSNQPTPQRQAYFAQHFPGIQFLVVKQKPYPDGLLQIIAREQISAKAIMLVDDRVLTGALAAILAGIQCILIEKPYICFWDNIFREILFIAIRFVERGLFK